MRLSIVIPIYGCRAAIYELYNRVVDSVSNITNDYELILVNDACPQNSWELIEELCKNDSKVVGIELSRNFGQMRAILAGLDCAKGDWIVVMDCDLQDRPEEIINLYNKAQEGYDVVVARRAERHDNRLKIALASLFYKVYKWAADGNYDGALCNFSIVKRDVIKNYCSMRELHRSYIMYLQWLGFKHAIIDVEHSERYEGKSSYNLKRRINMAIEILTSQSDKVLRVMVRFGMVLSALSFMSIIGIVIHYFVANVSSGWSSIVAVICFIGGIIVSSIGVVGLYVGNIFMQVKNRPLYVIRQVLNYKG